MTPLPEERGLGAPVEAALAHLESIVPGPVDVGLGNRGTLAGLKQVLERPDQYPGAPSPIRTVHHFACTGGTLIAKCLASMPNVLVLSEVEPHSELVPLSERRFSPSDLITLLRVSNRPPRTALIEDVFLTGLETIHRDCTRQGLRLLVRDHAHSKYCLGDAPHVDASVRGLIRRRFDLRSLVTVRHPIDSLLSLLNNRWMHFRPATLDEYVKRYEAFLDDHADLEVFRYEDFVAAPGEVAARMCRRLDLALNPAFEEMLGLFRLSGDSGRSSNTIGERQRRPVPEWLHREAHTSEGYHVLCQRLGYNAMLG